MFNRLIWGTVSLMCINFSVVVSQRGQNPVVIVKDAVCMLSFKVFLLIAWLTVD